MNGLAGIRLCRCAGAPRERQANGQGCSPGDPRCPPQLAPTPCSRHSLTITIAVLWYRGPAICRRGNDCMADFWLSCGHHLLDRDDGGGLLVTDEFLKAYLARPELAPPTNACAAEHGLHRALLEDPRRPVTSADIAGLADPDAREHWTLMRGFRDPPVRHKTVEAAYLDLVRHGVGAPPPLFINQLVHVILRNVFDGCDDVFMARAAELFFRPQRLSVVDGSLIAADEEKVSG